MTKVTHLTPLQCMEIHINTLFNLDTQGRLRSVNEIGEPPAPLFYMGRTRQGNIWRFRAGLPTTTIAELERLCQAEAIATDLARAPQHYAAIHAVLRQHLTGPTPIEFAGPAYWMPAPVDYAANVTVVPITPANIDLCHTTFPWLPPLIHHPRLGPVVAATVDGHAVSLCFCSRRPHVATEAGVETLAEFRGRGFATAVVAAWATLVRRQGVMPMYSAAWPNQASQAIARKLHMEMYGADWSIR